MRALLPVFLIILVDVLGLTLILPLLPFYSQELGATPFQVGLISATFAACQLVGGPILGRLSDRYGRKRLLLLSQAGTLVSYVMLAEAHSLALVYLSRVVGGLTAGNLSLAQAQIADVTAPKDRTKAFAVIGIAFGVAFLFGPAVSGFLSRYGHEVPIRSAAGLSAVSILATAVLLRAPKPGQKPQAADPNPGPGGRRLSILQWRVYADYLKRPALALPLKRFFAFSMAFSMVITGLPLFVERRLTWNGHPFGAAEVGYLYAYGGFLGILIQGGLLGRLSKRFGDDRLARAGFLSAALGYSALVAVHSLEPLLLLTLATSFGNSVLRPVLTSAVSRRAGANEQGTVLGLTQSLYSLSAILAPAIGGFLISQGWLAGWALAAAGCYAIGFLLSTQVEAETEAVLAGT